MGNVNSEMMVIIQNRKWIWGRKRCFFLRIIYFELWLYSVQMHTWPGGGHCFVIQVLFLIEAEEHSHALAITGHQVRWSLCPPVKWHLPPSEVKSLSKWSEISAHQVKWSHCPPSEVSIHQVKWNLSLPSEVKFLSAKLSEVSIFQVKSLSTSQTCWCSTVLFPNPLLPTSYSLS